jgi:hypothetical protein
MSPAAIYEAIRLCEERGAIPSWLADALTTLLGTGYKTPARRRSVLATLWRRHLSDLIDYVRYDEVVDARDHGLRWSDAYAIASALLTGKGARGSREQMKWSYRRVINRMRKAPGRYYLGRDAHEYIESKLVNPPAHQGETIQGFLEGLRDGESGATQMPK